MFIYIHIHRYVYYTMIIYIYIYVYIYMYIYLHTHSLTSNICLRDRRARRQLTLHHGRDAVHHLEPRLDYIMLYDW